MMRLLTLLICLMASPAWATLPTLPTTFEPGDIAPTPATHKFVCATVNVTGATNASPIVLNIGPHFFTNNETLTVASVGGNTAANGTWVITKVDGTHISLNGSTGNGAYTSGGTVACDYPTITAALSALGSNVWEIDLNQGETYVAPVSGFGSTTSNGFILPTRAGASQYVVLRTWNDGSGHLPADGQRVGWVHQPYLAKIQQGTSNQASMYAALTCKKNANHYWIKQIEFTVPSGLLNSSQASSGYIQCFFEELSSGFSTGTPTDKPITAITFVGSTVTVSIDIPSHGDMRLNSNEDITITCPSCGITGIDGKTYTMTRVNGGLCGGINGTCQLTFTEPSVGGTYTSGGTVSVANNNQWSSFIVMDQLFMDDAGKFISASNSPDHSATQHYKAFGISLGGSNQAIINSHIAAEGGASCELGEAIYGNGAQVVMIRNNDLSGSDIPIFTGGSTPYASGRYTTDWTIKQNSIFKQMKWYQFSGGSQAEYNYNSTDLCAKNVFEFKDMLRVLIDGNDISVGWNGRQGTMLHFTSLQINTDPDCGAVPGVVGSAGCGPQTQMGDLTFTNNRAQLMGYTCMNIVGQTGYSQLYATVRGSRYLVKNNLFLSCSGFPGIGGVANGGNGFSTGGGPQNLTISHNTWIRDITPTISGSGAWFRFFCTKNDNAINASCGIGDDASTVATGVMPGLTIQDNIIELHGESGAVEVWANAGGKLSCTTAGTLGAFAPSYVWDHNIAIGTMPGGCDSPNQGTLATGTQIVATEAAMNFRSFSAHDYCLTNTSPGYHAASDGTNVGVDPVALYSAMGLTYGPGACP